MVKIKSLDAIGKAYREGASRAPAAYKAGVLATTDWKQKAIEGQGLYEERMRDPSVLARRKVKLEQTSDQEWKEGASVRGAANIASGMIAKAPKQIKNYAPYHSLVSGMELPPRSADPNANIDNRLKPVALGQAALKRDLSR